MKRIAACVAAGVLTASLVSGQNAWGMNLFLASESDESKSPADKLQEVVDDLDAGSMFLNPMGYLAGHTYVNDSMGISLTIPDSFTIMDSENDNEVKYLVAAMDESTQEAFQLVEVDLIAAGEEDITEEECLEEYKIGMQNSGGFSIVSETTSSVILGADTYTLSDMSVDLDGMSGNVKSYCRIDGSMAYILTGISFENGSDGIAAILDSIAPLENGLWHGNTYINPLLGISLTFPENFAITKDTSVDEGVAYPVTAVDDKNGTTLQVVVMDFNEMEGGLSAYEGFDEEDVLRNFNEGIEESTGISMGDGITSEIEIGGEEFTLITVDVDSEDNGQGELRSYGRLEDDHALIIFTTEMSDDITVIDALMDSAVPSGVGTIDEETGTYMNPSLQMSMTLPESWTVISSYTKESSWDTAFQVGDYETGESILLQVYDLEELGEDDLTEEEYADVIRLQLDSSEGSTVEGDLGKAMIDGIPYSVVTVMSEFDGSTLEQKICYHIVDGQLFVFYLNAVPDDYSEGYNSILESMDFQQVY